MFQYCPSIYKTKRWLTREVMVGKVGVGGNNPIRIQSMTTSNTRAVDATIEQIMRLADEGCEIARVTVQGMKEADACEGIKNGLIQKGYTIPLVADIHFYPPAAMRVVDFVDKVRINPGNFVDKRATFVTLTYDDDTYLKEIEKIEEKFIPLVEKCIRLKRAMRIGTNHGSLSDRIMNRFGDTPQGMVESALEFARICRKLNYNDIIFSMKASNPQVMIQAYRLLVAEMMKLGWNYPLHLGVTEAGEGEDGRVKSAMGIGSLLLDGLGDTIRVSLTEDPWHEIEPCRQLVNFAAAYEEQKGVSPFIEKHRTIDQIQKRQIQLPKNVSLHRDGSVFLKVNQRSLEKNDIFEMLGFDQQLKQPKLKNASADGLIVEGEIKASSKVLLKNLNEIGVSCFSPISHSAHLKILRLEEAIDFRSQKQKNDLFNTLPMIDEAWGLKIQNEIVNEWEKITELQPNLIFLAPTRDRLHYCRHFFEWLQEHQILTPVILNFTYECSQEESVIQAAAEMGALLCDGLGNGVWIEGNGDLGFLRNLSFTILQSARMRTFKTDFISCPSCGRTLFDLQEVSKQIRARVSHLPGVKVAIMGCIVNGPGEMADADFGYVGSKPGMIDLYVGKECIEKNILFDNAVERLVALIKAHGRWIEPELNP